MDTGDRIVLDWESYDPMSEHANEAERLFDLGDTYSTKGAAALQADQLDQARDWFRQAVGAYEGALAVAPKDDHLLQCNLQLCIGAREYSLRDHDSALDRYNEVVRVMENRPDVAAGGEATEIHAQARLNRAECWLAQGDRIVAREEIEDVLAALPDHPYAKILLGRC